MCALESRCRSLGVRQYLGAHIKAPAHRTASSPEGWPVAGTGPREAQHEIMSHMNEQEECRPALSPGCGHGRGHGHQRILHAPLAYLVWRRTISTFRLEQEQAEAKRRNSSNYARDIRRVAEHYQPTETHRFIADLNSSRKLVRYYSQNVDGIETRTN